MSAQYQIRENGVLQEDLFSDPNEAYSVAVCRVDELAGPFGAKSIVLRRSPESLICWHVAEQEIEIIKTIEPL